MAKPPIPNEVWRLMSPEERLRGLLNMTLDQIHEILEEPIDYRQNSLMNAKTQVIRSILNTCTKLGIEDRRTEAERAKVLASLTKQMREESKTIDVLDEPIH
jgi:hypothetical protein